MGALTDWIDRDTRLGANGAEDGTYLRREPPHRTANTALASVMELRGLEGMTEELYQSIRPYLCAAPSITKPPCKLSRSGQQQVMEI